VSPFSNIEGRGKRRIPSLIEIKEVWSLLSLQRTWRPVKQALFSLHCQGWRFLSRITKGRASVEKTGRVAVKWGLWTV
jgi:hypothetical protein